MTAPLIIVPPLTITDSILYATDVAEDTNPAWSSATTYGLDARVYSGHTVYQSIQAGNLNHPVTDTDWWVTVGPTNRWALFDLSNSTQTAQATSMSYTLKPGGAVTALFALNLTGCNTVRVRVTHPTVTLTYDKTINVSRLPTQSSWWAWYYGERRQAVLALFTDLPALPGCTIVVDLAGTPSLAIGVLGVGQIKRIGLGVKSGARVGIDDYSRKETDEWGETVLIQRNFAKRASFDIPVPAAQVESSITLLNSLRAKPVLVIGSASRNSTVLFGFYKSYEVTHAYADTSELTIDFQDLA